MIFAMEFFSTHFGSQIKIRVLGPPEINFRSNLVKVAKNLQKARVWCKAIKKIKKN